MVILCIAIMGIFFIEFNARLCAVILHLFLIKVNKQIWQSLEIELIILFINKILWSRQHGRHKYSKYPENLNLWEFRGIK